MHLYILIVYGIVPIAAGASVYTLECATETHREVTACPYEDRKS